MVESDEDAGEDDSESEDDDTSLTLCMLCIYACRSLLARGSQASTAVVDSAATLCL